MVKGSIEVSRAFNGHKSAVKLRNGKVNEERENEVVAKASDGQRYPLPLSWWMLDVKVRGAAAPKEPMT